MGNITRFAATLAASVRDPYPLVPTALGAQIVPCIAPDGIRLPVVNRWRGHVPER